MPSHHQHSSDQEVFPLTITLTDIRMDIESSRNHTPQEFLEEKLLSTVSSFFLNKNLSLETKLQIWHSYIKNQRKPKRTVQI